MKVGDNIMSMNNFDIRPIPTLAKYTTFNHRYLEAKVLEDVKTLDLIYENYNSGNLTESEAITAINIVETDEGSLFNTLESVMNLEKHDEFIPAWIDPRFYIGESVLPYKEIIKTLENESYYTPYTFECSFDKSDSKVGYLCEIARDKKVKNLNSYKESKGAEGFSEFETKLYKNYPDLRIDRKTLFESAVDARTYNGSISIRENFALKNFFENAFAEQAVAQMMPVVGLMRANTTDIEKDVESMINGDNGEIDNDNHIDLDNLDLHLEEMVSSDRELAIDEAVNAFRISGGFLALEGVVYKNNATFDSLARTLFETLKGSIALSGDDDKATFTGALSVEKNKYTFSFKPDAKYEVIVAGIKKCGYIPIKNNNKVLRFERKTKDMLLTVDFQSVNTGISISYQNNVTESVVIKEAADSLLAKLVESRKEREIINSNYNEYLLTNSEGNMFKDKTYDESVDTFEQINTNEKTILSTESADFVAERKHVLVEALNNLVSGIVEDAGIDNFMVSLISNSPTDKLFTEAYNVLETIFDRKKTDEEYTESVNKFIKAYDSQLFDEHACEVVLNQKEFEESVFTEAEEKSDGHVSDHNGDGVDDEIAPIVNLLNKLGYNVKYSSSGYDKSRIKEDKNKDGSYYGKLYTTARITFDKHYDFKTVPKGWYFNKNADTSSMYVRAFTYNAKDGSPDEAFTKWKKTYMASLKSWAENLKSANGTEDAEKAMEEAVAFNESVLNDIDSEIDNLI